MNVVDIDKWLIVNDPEFNMNDNKIVQPVPYDCNNTPFLEKIEEPEEKTSFSTTYLALQRSLSFSEKQPDVTS